MCGIIGMFCSTTATDKQLRMFKHLLLVDQLRGEHATGIAKIDRSANTVDVIKMASDAVDFLANEDVKTFLDKDRGHIYIGHNRYATTGARDNTGAHPFSSEHITLVHNGSVDTWELSKLDGYSNPDVTVDSEMVCHTLATRGVKEAVEEYFSGAFSLVWWNDIERSLNFIRNDERPMYLAWLNDGTMVWASEEEFINTYVNRDRVLGFVKDGECMPTVVGRHYKWVFTEEGKLENKGNPYVEDYTFKESTWSYPAVSRFSGNYGNSYNRPSYEHYNTSGPEGINLGSKDFVEVRNTTLEANKLVERIGDKICFTVTDFEPYTTARGSETSRGTITGVYKGIPVTAYSMPKDSCHNGDTLVSRMEGYLTSAYEVTNGTAAKQLKLVVEKAVKSTEKKPRLLLKFNKDSQFPLKVQGLTFISETDFKAVVSCGCAVCGRVPGINNAFNKDMCVYPNVDSSVIPSYDYICGACINEDGIDTYNLLGYSL